MIREILQLHFEKIIHVYTVLQKWKKGQLRNFKCSSWTEDKILKKHKKNTKKKKIEKSKLVTSKAILLKIRYFFFFFKLSFPKYPKMERPSENSSNFFLALFVPNWEEAMSTHDLENLGHGVKAIRAKSFCKRNAVT